MRVLVRVVLVSAAVLVSRLAAAADLRPRLVITFGSEVGHPGESVNVDVASLDASGAPADAQVAIDADLGKLTPPQRISPGVYRASIAIPTKLPQSRTLLVLAHAGALSAAASLRLGPNPAATMKVDGPNTCSQDAEACRLDVTAADSYGNPAVEVPDATAELGRISPAGTAEPGRWVIIYHPPRLDRERTERVTVALGTLKAVHEMKLPGSSTRLGFAPLLGAVRQDSHNGFSAAGQVVGLRAVGSGWLVGAGAEGAWWSGSQSSTASGLQVSTDRSQIAVGLFVQAERPFTGGVVTAFSVGGGAARIDSTEHVEGQPGVSDSGWAPTARGTAMLGYRFGFGTPFLEGRVAWVGDAHLVTDPGAQWPLFLQLGYRLDVL
jgi:hypothetical protein